jgi:hypothetical protein
MQQFAVSTDSLGGLFVVAQTQEPESTPTRWLTEDELGSTEAGSEAMAACRAMRA